VNITALSNHKPGILNNYIRMFNDIVLIKASTLYDCGYPVWALCFFST